MALSSAERALTTARTAAKHGPFATQYLNVTGALEATTALLNEIVRYLAPELRDPVTSHLKACRSLLRSIGAISSGLATPSPIPFIRATATALGLDVEASLDNGKSWETVDLYRYDTRELTPWYIPPKQGFDAEVLRKAYFTSLTERGISFHPAPARPA